MIDLKQLREDPDRFKQAARDKNMDIDVERLVVLDEKMRRLRHDAETRRSEQKKISKEIKGLNKAVRNYDSYKVLEESVKAMLTSLPLVSDLHHPAMRERHWQQLMVATGKHFVKDEKFNLGDLLALDGVVRPAARADELLA